MEEPEPEPQMKTGWKELYCTREKWWTGFMIFSKIFGLFACLYFFICSLSLLESSVKLLGGQEAGATFRSSFIQKNPIVQLMLGVLVTVLVQSSSTTTSIIVGLVGSGVIDIHSAVPMVMGANIGTSITNTFVSLAQIHCEDEFQLAFTGAIVHDLFNWLTVLVLLPLEVLTNYLVHLTEAIIKSTELQQKYKHQDLLKVLTKVFTDYIVKVDDKSIIGSAVDANFTGGTLKRWCKQRKVNKSLILPRSHQFTVDCQNAHNVIVNVSVFCNSQWTPQFNNSFNVTLSWNVEEIRNVTENIGRCKNLFALTDLEDKPTGALLIIMALLILFLTLFLLVKILNQLLKGSVAKAITKVINADFPGKLAFLTGYVAILVGCGLTMIIQSSSVFTSTLTPLVGVGVITVDRMYPLTLGSNIGTTVTAILAALSSSGSNIASSLQIALCHLFFNITGVVLFYPIPFLRKIPINVAKVLGRVTKKYRWFAIFYIIVYFFVIPVYFFIISFGGVIVISVFGGIPFVITIVAISINIIQHHHPNWLPQKLRNWDFLPHWLHSLSPLDRIIHRVFICQCCLKNCNCVPVGEDRIVVSALGDSV